MKDQIMSATSNRVHTVVNTNTYTNEHTNNNDALYDFTTTNNNINNNNNNNDIMHLIQSFTENKSALTFGKFFCEEAHGPLCSPNI